MPPTNITGVRATAASQGILSNARVIDMSDTIHLLDPNEAPLTAVTMKLRTVSSINPKIEWLEDDYIASSDVTTTTATAGNTTITPTNPSYFRVGDVLKSLDSGEVLLVTAVSADTLGVTRAIGGTAAVDIDLGKTLLIIGNANAEFSTSRVIKTAKKTALYNYAQIFRWEFGASGTLQASELYGGDDLGYQRRKNGKEFRIMLERSFLWGERSASENPLSGTTPTRLAGGIIERITTNVTTLTTITAATFETFLGTAMRYGPARKMFFCSRDIVSYLSLIAGAKIQTRPTDKSFPLALTEYVSPHGKCFIATHNLLEGAGANGLAYGGWGLMLDLDAIFMRPLRGRNTMLRTNIQANDADGRIDGYLAECGPQLVQEKNHSILKGVSKYA